MAGDAKTGGHNLRLAGFICNWYLFIKTTCYLPVTDIFINFGANQTKWRPWRHADKKAELGVALVVQDKGVANTDAHLKVSRHLAP